MVTRVNEKEYKARLKELGLDYARGVEAPSWYVHGA
jgi:hypothetical protein